MSRPLALEGPDERSSPTPLGRAFELVYGAALVAIPFARVGLVPVGPTFLQVADVAFAVAALLWLALVARRELPLPPMRALAPIGLWLAAALLSLVAAPSLRGALVKLLALCYLAAIALLTASLGSTARGLRFALRAVTFGAGVTGALGCLSVLLFYLGVRDRAVNIFLWNYGSIPTGAYPRVVVFFMNANMLQSYLLVGVSAAGALAALTAGLERKLALAAIVAMSVTSVFTLSTGLGGLGLMLAGALVVVPRWRGAKKSLARELVLLGGALAVALGLTVVTVFLLVPKGAGDVRLGPVDLSLETSGRVDVWKGAAKTFAARPLTGAGIGTLVAETSHVRALNTTEQLSSGGPLVTTARKMEAHNVWLNVAGQLGVLGLLAALWLTVEATRAAWWRRAGGDVAPSLAEREARLAVLLGLLGALGYHGLFGAFEDARHVWFLFGLAFAVGATFVGGRAASQLRQSPDADEREPTLETPT